MRSIVSGILLFFALFAAGPGAGAAVEEGGEIAGSDRSQAYYHFLLAKGYEFEHLYDDAIGELQQALQFDQQNSFIHGELAGLYQRLGREGKALEHGHAAITADPENVEARVFLGMLYFKRSRQDEGNRDEMIGKAIEQFQQALLLDPDREDAYLDLSHIYHVIKRDQEARDLLQQFLERSPYSERALFALGNIHWSRQEWDEALNVYLRILEIDPGSIRALLDVADTYKNLDEPESALQHYLHALVKNPESFNILNQVATCYEDLRELDLAARYYQKALAVKPDSLDVVESLGNVAFMGRRYVEATGFYLQVLEAEPERMVARFNLSRSYKGLGESTLALAHLDRLHRKLETVFGEGSGTEDLKRFRRLVLEQLANIHVSLEQLDQALTVLLEASEPEEIPDLEVLHNLARVYHMKGDVESALGVFARCREQFPDQQETSLLEAEMLLDVGRGEPAQQVLARVHRRAVEQGVSTDLWRRLTMLYTDSGRLEEAVKLLDAINAAEDGKTAMSLFFLARVRLEKDDLSGAMAAVKDAQKRYPGDDDFTYLECEVLLRQERVPPCRDLVSGMLKNEKTTAEDYLRAALLYTQYERLDLAEEILEQGLGRFADHGTLLFQLGATIEREGRMEDAVKRFRHLLVLEPDNAQALNYLGYMLADNGVHLDEAIALVGRALRLEPRNGAYLDSMGWALFKAGKTRQAGNYLLDALKLIPEDPTIREHVGDYYMALGRREEALPQYGKALEYGAADPAALERKMALPLEEPADREGTAPDGAPAEDLPEGDPGDKDEMGRES